jgi:hypothetical protein
MPLRQLRSLSPALFAVLMASLAAIAAAETPPPAPEPYRIPLSSVTFANEPKVDERAVDAGKLRISFADLVPTVSYNISWHTTQDVAPPINLGDVVVAFGAKTGSDCAEVATRTEDLWKAKTEAEVAAIVSRLRTLLATGNCTADDPVTKKAKAAIDATLWGQVIEATIEPGTVLEIQVTRLSQTITFVFRGPEPSRFFQTYGFSYLRNNNEAFFTEKNSAGKFVIRPQARRSDWEPAGLLLLNYRLAGPLTDADIGINASGALSFDGDKPAVGVGMNFTLSNNLGLSVGYAMSKVDRLRGRYRAGDQGTLLDVDLAADQLVDQQIKGSFYVGLSLNLSSNPFKKKAEATTAPAAGSK